MKARQILKASLMLAGVWILISGCGTSESPNQEESASLSPDRLWLEPVRNRHGIIGRSVFACPTGNCIVLHYPPAGVKQQDFSVCLQPTGGTNAVDLKTYTDQDNRWNCSQDHLTTNSTFNCCTYAVGDVVGLNVNDWISPQSNGDTCFTIPMQVLLDSYFDLVKVIKLPVSDWSTLETDADLRNGDVLCCVDGAASAPNFAHTGKIVKAGDRNLLASKLGSGPIIRGSIKATVAIYADYCNELHIYRAKPGTTKPPQAARST